jgi:hypothetical protein
MGNFVTGSRIIGAAPERVWDLLVRVDRWPSTFTPHLREAHLDGDLAVGATGWVRTRLPLPRSPFVVTALEPGRSWAWRGDLLWLTLDFNHRVEAEGIVGTRVTFDLDLTGTGAWQRPPKGGAIPRVHWPDGVLHPHGITTAQQVHAVEWR